MDPLSVAFDERLDEIQAYLSFLEAIEIQLQSGPTRIGADGPVITTQQQRILYSSVFLQLYNLVEATIVRCLDAVTNAALADGLWGAGDLTEALRREWLRVTAKTHAEMNFENRLKNTFDLCDHLVNALPITGFKMEKGGGGNWDDEQIESIANRLGLQLVVSAEVYSGVKRPIRDDLGPLGLAVKLRNDLAHGSISFAECGENQSAQQLKDLVNKTAAYLREVVGAFNHYLQEHGYLIPERRPRRAG